MLPPPALAQFGAVPGPTVAATGLLTLLVALGLAVWVGLDAADHSDHPLAWALATLVGGLSPLAVGAVAVTLLYRRSREELGSIAPPSVRNESEIQRGEVLGEAVDKRRRAERTQSPAGATDGGEIPGTKVDGEAEWDGSDDAEFSASGEFGAGGESSRNAESGVDRASSRDAESGVDAETAADDDFGGFEKADPVEDGEGSQRGS